MNAIVIVFIPVPDGQRCEEQPVLGGRFDILPRSANLEKTRGRLSQFTDWNQKTPPFWTWFIENPRRRGV
jgi:hypothetical protein